MLLSSNPSFEVVGEAQDGLEAIRSVEAYKPDLILMDLSMPRMNGVGAIQEIKKQSPSTKILVLTVHEESLYAERCLRAGAKGYLMKDEAMENVLRAIRRVLTGQVYLSDKMQAKLFTDSGRRTQPALQSPLERLSDRELEVFRLLGQGLGTRRVAELLHVSISTVESHRARIKEKLDIKCATELLQQAVKWVETEGSE